jgi:hypothetical protein
VKARKIVKQPGPYQSVLNSHLVEIAQLRETRPQPTPYRAIAKILKEKYRLEVSPNSIWSFVRARTLGRGRKLKYKIAPDLVVQLPAALAPSTGPIGLTVGGAEQQTDQQLSAIEAARARAKARTQKQETKKWDLGYDPNKPLKDQT